jgi:hypothetical protein
LAIIRSSCTDFNLIINCFFPGEKPVLKLKSPNEMAPISLGEFE